MSEQAMPVGQFHPKPHFGQRFHYPALNLDGIFAGHVKISGSASVINTECSK
jgi:hypothetical protein